MNQILDWILAGRLQLIHRDLMRLRALFSLDANHRFEIITAERARASDYDEAAFRLRLMCPRVGERAPSRLVFREAAFVAGDGHAVFVDFQAGRLVNDGRDFDRRSPVVEPRSESHAVAQIIEQRSAPARPLVPPTLRLLAFDLLIGDLDLVREVIEGAAVAVV